MKPNFLHVLSNFCWRADQTPTDVSPRLEAIVLKAVWKRSSKKQKPMTEGRIGSNPCSYCPHVRVGKALIHELLPKSLAPAAHWCVSVCVNDTFCKTLWVP